MQSFQGFNTGNPPRPPALRVCFCSYIDTAVPRYFHTHTQDLQPTAIQVSLTSKPIRHVCFKHNVAENRWERERLVALVPKGNVSVTCLQTIQGQDPLTNQLIVVIVHCYPQDGEIREDHLESQKRKEVSDSARAAPSPPPIFEPFTLYGRNSPAPLGDNVIPYKLHTWTLIFPRKAGFFHPK